MKSLTLPSAISLTAVLVSALLQTPTSVAEEARSPKQLAGNTHDAQATGPGEAAEETLMIQFVSDEALPAPAERKIKVIRAGSVHALDSATLQRLLPPEVIKAQHDRLNQRNALTDMNVDIIVDDQAGQHVVLGDFNHSKSGMGHRMRPNPGLRWIETGPLYEPTQLNAKAAACILKSLTKVTTESGTRLLREACQAAYPDN